MLACCEPQHSVRVAGILNDNLPATMTDKEFVEQYRPHAEPLDDDFYHLGPEEAAFFKSWTGINDDEKLKQQEALVDTHLPALEERFVTLETEAAQLQQRADELNSSDKEELQAAREELIAADAEIAEKKRLLASLQEELHDRCQESLPIFAGIVTDHKIDPEGGIFRAVDENRHRGVVL